MVIRTGNRNNRQPRFLCWILIVLMLINMISPAEFALGESREADSWDISYSLSRQEDGEYEIADDNGEIALAVKEGEEVFFAIQMISKSEENADRFKDTIRIRMPEMVYRALSETNGEPDEWFESGVTDSGYLMKLKDSVASASNAGDGVKSFGASLSDASSSELPANMIELNFQFADSLRGEVNPKGIGIEDTDYQLSFMAPEDMVLVCRTDKNNCELTISDNVPASPVKESCWNVSSSLVIARDGQELPQNPGGFIYIIPGDVIEFGFRADIKSEVVGESGRYEETFKVTMPGTLYELVKDKIIWPEIEGMTENGKVFKDPVKATRNPDGSYVVEFEFEDFSNADLLLTWAGATFKFEAEEKILMGYEHQEEDSSTEISYRPIPQTAFNKEVVGVISEDELRYGTKSAAANGDYVLFKIRVQINSPVAGERYEFEPHEVYDFFYTDAYEFVDITSANQHQVDQLISWVSNSKGASEDQKKTVLTVLESDNDTIKSWDQINDSDSLPSELETYKDSHCFYGNRDGFVLDKQNAEDIWTTIDLYLCLQIKDEEEFDLEGTYTEDGEEKPNSDKLKNNVFLDKYSDGSIKTGTPGTDIYYDVALTLGSTSIWHSDTGHASAIGKNNKFPEIEGSDLAMVRPGDYVTYRISTSSRGSKMANISKIFFYLPRGLEPVEQSELAQISGFKYAVSPESKESVSSQWRDALSASHVYPVSGGGGISSYDDYEPGGLSGYGGLYGVRSYAYTYDPHSRADIYITCKVKDIETVISEAGYPDDDPDSVQMAKRYAYLLTAEIGEATDAYNPNLMISEDEAAAYRDCDSLLDSNPFNDWYSIETGALKNSDLYWYGSYTSDGEHDDDTSNQIRGMEFGWNNPGRDEDDFDYSVVYPYEAKPLESSVLKEVYELSKEEQMEITGIISDIDPNYMLLTNGMLSRTQTVIPYVVKINPDGSTQMDDLVFKDTLPASMSFLTFADGTPVVKIKERVERNGHRYPAEGIPGGIIEEAYSDLLTVKGYLSEEYIPQPGCEMPETVQENETAGIYYWDAVVADKTLLTIDFGNINNNSFEIIYYAVVDKVSNAYINSAHISWGEHFVKEVSVTFSKWEASATAGAYSKYVSLKEEGPFDKSEASADEISADQGITVYYRLGAMVSPKDRTYDQDTLLFVDHIESAVAGGQPVKADISILKIEEKVGDETNTFLAPGGPAAELAGELFRASLSKDAVQIGNMAAISEAVTVNVYISVHYTTVDYGSQITNLFQNTTQVRVPLRLDLVKVDGSREHEQGGLPDAEFALTYEDGSSVLKNGKDGEQVILKTAGDGKAAAGFHLDSDRKHSGDQCYYLNLTETKAPGDYFYLGGKSGDPAVPYMIRLKVTEDSTGTYVCQAVEEDQDFSFMSTGPLNEIRIKAKNYRPAPAEINLRAYKELAGRIIKDQEFSFKASLIYASNKQKIADLTSANDESATVEFATLKVDEAGEYVFEISEDRIGSDNSIYYDTTKYYAAVSVIRNSAGVLEVADLHYGDRYDRDTHEVSGADQEPVFKNQVIRYIVIRKLSYSGSRPLTGAKFELSCRKADSGRDEWEVLSGNLITAGSDGSVRVILPAGYQTYEYRLIEKEAPAGYTSSQVGVITFTVDESGVPAKLVHTGSEGYVEQGTDKTQIVVKNDTISDDSGGDDDDDDGGDSSPPLSPTRPVPAITPEEPVIGDEMVPLASGPGWPVPIGQLALTGDQSARTWLLVTVVLAALGGFIITGYLMKKKKRS